MAATRTDYALSMTCCLGNHPLHNPKLLPCQHSFCTQCIKNDIGKERKIFVCPKCQLPIPLTEKDVDQLPEDVLFHVLQKTEDNADCVLCEFQDKKTPGTFQCLDCADVLCSQCQKGHTMSTHTRLHRVVSRRDIQQGKYKDEIQAEKQLICDTHSKPNKPMVLEYYCQQCKCLACQLCVIKVHQLQGHTCNTIDEIHDEKMTAVTDHLTKILDMKRVVEEFSAVLEQELECNKEQREKLENLVHDRATTFIEMIETFKEETLTTLRGHFDKDDTSIQTRLDETKNRIIRIDSLVSYTQAFLKHSTKSQLLLHENDAVKNLADQNPKYMDFTLKTYSIGLGEPRIAKTETICTDVFGKIKISGKALSSVGVHTSRELMKEPKVLFRVNSGIGNAWDLTMTENGNIVAVSDSIIQVYGSDGKSKERIQCGQLQRAWNVVSMADTLYVSNRTGNISCLVMDFKGNVKKSIPSAQTSYSYSYSFDNCIKGLAVDDEGNIFVSDCTTKNIYKCEPQEINAKVFIKHDKNLDLHGPYYQCVTPGGELVVSNCNSNTIQVYNRLGELLWQYKGQGDMKLSLPRGVYCDRHYNIYICDFYNDRIQVIQDNVFKGCIRLKDFEKPRCIATDKDDNIVCGYNEGKNIVKLKVWE